MRKNSLFSLALLAIGLFWASCKGTDPGPSALLQTENDVLSNGGVWKVDTAGYELVDTIAGVATLVDSYKYWKMDTLAFQPISNDTVLTAGFGGLRRGLLIRQHTANGVTSNDTMNWQVAPASLIDETPRIVVFYNPGPNEVQYSFILKEHSASKAVMTAERNLVDNGFKAHGKRRYDLSR